MYWRAPDSSTTNYFPQERTFEEIENYGLYIALEIGGEPIPYKLGYPTQLYYGGSNAGQDIREVSEINVITHDFSVVEENPYADMIHGYVTAGIAYLAGEPGVGRAEEHAHAQHQAQQAGEIGLQQHALYLGLLLFLCRSLFCFLPKLLHDSTSSLFASSF